MLTSDRPDRGWLREMGEKPDKGQVAGGTGMPLLRMRLGEEIEADAQCRQMHAKVGEETPVKRPDQASGNSSLTAEQGSMRKRTKNEPNGQGPDRGPTTIVAFS